MRWQGDRLVKSLSLCKRYPWFLALVQITDLHISRNPCLAMVRKILASPNSLLSLSLLEL